jgi:hypothetical protein
MRRAEAGIQVDKFYPPTDWLDNNSKQIDIRKNAENNSIVLLVGHSADFSKYSLLGLLADTSAGTYDIYIDDVLVGSGVTKNTQYDIDFSTINTSYGSATTPESLVLHKVVVKPNTNGSTITKFRCMRTAGVTTQQTQGVLWCHFELANEINIVESFGTGGGNIAEGRLYAITSKGDYIDVGTNSIAGMLNGAGGIRHLPLFSSFNFANSGFRGLQHLKRIRVVNWNTNNSSYVFYNSNSIEKIDIRKITTSSLTTNFFNLNFKLKLLPFKNAIPSTTNLTDVLTQDEALFPTKLDFSNLVALTKITTMGGNRVMRGLRGLKVSNEAPFSGSSPQINVSYTGLDRDALVELFTSLPTVTGSQILKCDHCTGTADLTEADKQIATDKGWGLTLS